MQALTFDTKILQDGIIKIPELSNWNNYEVSIFIVRKPSKKEDKRITTKRQNYDSKKLIAEFHRVRQIKTGKAEVLTMDKAINIYDELTNISG